MLNEIVRNVGREGRANCVCNRFEETVMEDLAFLRDSKWIRNGTKLIGLKYDTHAGVLHEVQELES
jgi:hypothetical protein